MPLAGLWLATMVRVVDEVRLPRWLTVLIAATAVAVLIVVVANPAGIYRGAPTPIPLGGGTPRLREQDFGWFFFWVMIPYVQGLLLLAVAVLARGVVRRGALRRKQLLLLLAATLLPQAIGLLFTLDLAPWAKYDPAMAEIALAGAVSGWVFWRYRMLGLAPLARGAVIEHLPDGVIVFNHDLKVVDTNPAARTIFAASRAAVPSKRCSRRIRRCLTRWTGTLRVLSERWLGMTSIPTRSG